MSSSLTCPIPLAFSDLFRPARYKVYHGGRGGAKSWNFARALIALAYTGTRRILCVREFQTSIKDSVHKLLKDQINMLDLAPYFIITDNSIKCLITGSEFLFKGLRRSLDEIRSTEGIDICWVEEAHSVSEYSWSVLIPTIRKENSEIWASFNPLEETDPTWVRFVVQTHPDAIVKKVGFEDNPYFPKVLDQERLFLLQTDPEAYEHVWGGNCRTIGDAVVFRGRYSVETFETPVDARLYYGVDWGFADDPCAIVRNWDDGDTLYIDYESYGHHVELYDLKALFEGGESQDGSTYYQGVPGVNNWPLKADNSRPETISYMQNQGFSISAADKWPGCVEDRVAHLKGFRRIVIHERCIQTAQEFRLYSYKVDPNVLVPDPKTGTVRPAILPILLDKNNHCIDALGYSRDGYIQRRGGDGVWTKLAQD